MADPIIIEYAMARLLSTGHAGSDHASGWVKLENLIIENMFKGRLRFSGKR